jgi:hypothetical protein
LHPTEWAAGPERLSLLEPSIQTREEESEWRVEKEGLKEGKGRGEGGWTSG